MKILPDVNSPTWAGLYVGAMQGGFIGGVVMIIAAFFMPTVHGAAEIAMFGGLAAGISFAGLVDIYKQRRAREQDIRD